MDDYTPDDGYSHRGRCDFCKRLTFVIELTMVRGIPRMANAMSASDNGFLKELGNHTDRHVPDLQTDSYTLCKGCVKILEGRLRGASIGTKKGGPG